jgi:transposase
MNRKFIMHADNARPHTANVVLDFMERNAMKRAPHPPHSPDLASSEFCLFDHLKQLLRGHEFADREVLLYAIEDILGTLKNDIGRRLSQLDGEIPPIW